MQAASFLTHNVFDESQLTMSFPKRKKGEGMIWRYRMQQSNSDKWQVEAAWESDVHRQENYDRRKAGLQHNS